MITLDNKYLIQQSASRPQIVLANHCEIGDRALKMNIYFYMQNIFRNLLFDSDDGRPIRFHTGTEKLCPPVNKEKELCIEYNYY